MIETQYVKSSLPEGGIYNVSFGYNSKMEGYTEVRRNTPAG